MKWFCCGVVSKTKSGLEGGEGMGEDVGGEEEVMVNVEGMIVGGGDNGASTCMLSKDSAPFV